MQTQAEGKAYRLEVEVPSRPCFADTENRLINMLGSGSKGIRCQKKRFFLP